MNDTATNRDLALPAWGPYSKRISGASHIPDRRWGVRFDLSVFPAYYRGRVEVPDARWASSWHPWEASADLRYYTLRHELEWKDRVYTDVSFCDVDEDTRLIRCEYVNTTDAPQSLCLHIFAGLAFPEVKPGCDEVLDEIVVDLPRKHVFARAVAYDSLEFATTRPTDNLVYDSLRRGETLGQGFVMGSGVGCGFGADGDRLTITLTSEHEFDDARLLVRLRAARDGDGTGGESGEGGPAGAAPSVRLNGLVSASVSTTSPELEVVGVPVGRVRAGTHALSVIGTGDGAVEIDSFTIVEAHEAGAVRFTRRRYSDRPTIDRSDDPRSVELHYEELDVIDPELRYRIGWDAEPAAVREFLTDHLDELVRRAAHDHVRSVITDRWRGESGGDHYTNVFVRPISLEAGERKTVWAWASAGRSREAREAVRKLAKTTNEERERVYRESRSRRVTRARSVAGRELGQDLMAATTLTNVVYPVRRCGHNVIHNTPGRWWNSLYTWDSGFIGLGLLELDRDRALDCLRMYLADPADEHHAFIHHGSPVPVQIYLFHEMWNRGPDDDLLADLYPELRRYHAFLAGRLGSSTTDRFRSHLLATWDYFYNSGGWDDYPPQVHVHRETLERSVAPASNTAHAIRTAKILHDAASQLGLNDDCEEYERDIARFTEALQDHAYDPESGYYSYVTHDDAGAPQGPLRHESGANFNMGLDGAYPLVAGVCTEAQAERLLGYLEDPDRLWTEIGLSTVDQSAPYYRIDGYWNGAVWFPHQWFVWKSCLDLGRADLAWKIARTALDLWDREVTPSYNCHEHFIIETKRGAGWHQFSGLSTPVLLWYGAYNEPGRLTFGFDAWLTSPVLRTDAGCSTRVRTRAGSSPAGRGVIGLYCLDPGSGVTVSYDGRPVPVGETAPGVIAFELPRGGEAELIVEAARA